jgi:hypothetical protein
MAAVLLVLFLARLGREPLPGRLLPGLAAMASGGGVALTPVLIVASPPAPDLSALLGSLAAVQGLAGALVLGAAMSAMLLGHFYLVVPGLAIAPLRRLTRGFVGAVGLKILLGGLAVSSLGLPGSWLASAPAPAHPGVDPVGALLLGTVPLLMRVLFGLVGALILGLMSERTVAIRSTQSATGILYAAVVFVLIGEYAAGHLLVAQGLPL